MNLRSELFFFTTNFDKALKDSEVNLIEVESHYDYYKPGGSGKGYGALYGLVIHPID